MYFGSLHVQVKRLMRKETHTEVKTASTSLVLSTPPLTRGLVFCSFLSPLLRVDDGRERGDGTVGV